MKSSLHLGSYSDITLETLDSCDNQNQHGWSENKSVKPTIPRPGFYASAIIDYMALNKASIFFKYLTSKMKHGVRNLKWKNYYK